MRVFGFGLVEFAALLAAGATAVVGLFIAFHAYRGVRRNDSRPMWFLSVGLVLLFGVTYLVALTGRALIAIRWLPVLYEAPFRLVVRLLQLAGLLLIAYSMVLASRADGTRLRKD